MDQDDRDRDHEVRAARLETQVEALTDAFEHLRDEVKYLSRTVVQRLIWVVIGLSGALAGKDLISLVG